MTRVLISGGGVAGPALAYWLQRFGFEPTIIEKAPELRSGGQRIEIGESGQQVLDRMGLLERARAVGGVQPRSVVNLGRADRAVRVPDVGVGTSAMTGRLTMKRSDLGSLLHECVPSTVPYLFADSIAAVRQEPDGVHVSLESGATRTFDLVVGADGLYSTVRRLVFGEHERFLRYLGADQAYFTMDNFLEWRDLSCFHAWPHRGAAVTTYPGNAELEGLFLLRSPEPTVPRSADRDEQWGRVEKEFAGDRWLVPNMLRASRSADDFRLMPCMQVEMDTWHCGKVALIGDAAHCPDPMAGQGAMLALTGAYVLAGELAEAGGDPDTAFPAYENTIREFVAANQNLGDLDIAMAAPRIGRVRLWARDQALRVALPSLKLALRLGLRPRWITATQPFTLPEYEGTLERHGTRVDNE